MLTGKGGKEIVMLPVHRELKEKLAELFRGKETWNALLTRIYEEHMQRQEALEKEKRDA